MATGVGIYGLSVLMGLFLFEALLTLRSIPVRLSMLGQLSQQQSEAMAQREDMVRIHARTAQPAIRRNQIARSDSVRLPEDAGRALLWTG